jgi:peptide/nickel transport system substrate-binding protein
VQPGERLILRRNPDYWAQDLPVQRGMFNFDEIEIDYYRDADSSFEAFKAGLCDFRQETDAARWISSYDFPAVRDGRTVKESLPYGLPKGMEDFAFNMRRSIFGDVRVREALGMMFDFEWINALRRAHVYSGLEWTTSPICSRGQSSGPKLRALCCSSRSIIRSLKKV